MCSVGHSPHCGSSSLNPRKQRSPHMNAATFFCDNISISPIHVNNHGISLTQNSIKIREGNCWSARNTSNHGDASFEILHTFDWSENRARRAGMIHAFTVPTTRHLRHNRSINWLTYAMTHQYFEWTDCAHNSLQGFFSQLNGADEILTNYANFCALSSAYNFIQSLKISMRYQYYRIYRSTFIELPALINEVEITLQTDT